jgi:hypothetical protein
MVALKWSLSSFFIERMTQVVHARADMREQLRKPVPLSVLFERERRRARLNLLRTFCPWSAVSFGLGSNESTRDNARRAEDDSLGLGGNAAARVIGSSAASRSASSPA